MKGQVDIPASELAVQIRTTAQLHGRATVLLRRLEEAYLVRPVTKIGGWRQAPASFKQRG